MLEFGAVQQIAHKLENVYDLLRKDRMPLTESGINLLFEGRDVLTALVRAAVAGGEPPTGVEEYVERLDAFAGVYDSTAQAIEGPRAELDAEEDLTPLDDAQVAAFQAEVERLLAASVAQRTTRGAAVDATRRKLRSMRSSMRGRCCRRNRRAQPAPQRAAKPRRSAPRRRLRRRCAPMRSAPRRIRRFASTSSGSICC